MADDTPPPGLDEFLASSNQPTPAPQGETPMSPEPTRNPAVQQGAEPSMGDEPPGLDDYVRSIKYGGFGEQVKTGLEGVAEGVAGPLAPLAERALGVKPEDIRGRREENPLTHSIGQTAGFVGSLATGVGEGALIAKAGAKLVPEAAQAAGFLTKVGNSAMRNAAEMALLQSGDEISKMITRDPHQTLHTAITDVGLASAMGGVLGAGIGAINPLWNATIGGKAGKMIDEFKSRMAEHINNPEPVEALTKELQDFHTSVTEPASEVYGAQGLKAEAIEKLMPEMHEGIANQKDFLLEKLDKSLSKLSEDPLYSKLSDQVKEFRAKVEPTIDPITLQPTKEVTPSQFFDAAQDLKQQLHEWGKFNKNIVPLGEQGFRNEAKSLGNTFKEALEDRDVWGKAAKVQQDINGAFKSYLPNLQQFEKTFMTKVPNAETGAIEMQINPGKIQTYLNQLGKPSAEIKKEFLENFVKSSENYKNQIHNVYDKLGVESGIVNTPLNSVMSTLGEKTAGAKLADAFVKHSLSKVSGDVIGGSVGASLGHAVGLGPLGAILGQQALGPFFSSILPSIAKPIMNSITRAQGLKAAVDYGMSVVKGEELITKGARNVFKQDASVLPSSAMPSDKDIAKLDKILLKAQTNPEALASVSGSGDTGHYLPGHNEALGQTAAQAAQYLNSIRPQNIKGAPLDGPMPTSATEKAQFTRALKVAQQPLLILKSVKEGTVTPDDVRLIQNVYPNLYQKLNQQLTNAMIEHTAKGDVIPYKTRLGLSMMSAQAMDSTMHPQAIMAAQLKAPQQPGSDQDRPISSASKGKMIGAKSNRMSFTPNQAAEMDRQRKE
jgi:hypothetical protein